jgi:hypothetical protein
MIKPCPNCGGYCMHARGCEGDWAGGALGQFQNPITRTSIRLVPPIELRTAADFHAFCDWMMAYCRREWETVSEYGLRNDPEVVDASGWREETVGTQH